MGIGFNLGWPYVLGYSIDENMEYFKEDTASFLPFV